MRMRLGILHDSAAQDRMHAREAAEAAAKKKAAETPTVKTEAQIKAEEAEAAEEKKNPEKPKVYKPKIRPLSEARAIELGANFIAESFVFLVALGCIFAERIYSGRKESTRRDELGERLQALEDHIGKVSYLESEVKRLRAKYEADTGLDDAPSGQGELPLVKATPTDMDSIPEAVKDDGKSQVDPHKSQLSEKKESE